MNSEQQFSTFQSLLSVCNSGKSKSPNDYHEHTNTHKCCMCMNNSREQEQDRFWREIWEQQKEGTTTTAMGVRFEQKSVHWSLQQKTSARPSAAGVRFRSRSRYTEVSSRNIRRTFNRSLYELLNKHWTSREKRCGEDECDSFELGRCVAFRI